jgi:hypothetical protein
MLLGDVLLILLAGCGSSFIVTHGSLFKQVRAFVANKMYALISDLIHCPQCLSYYTGALAYAFYCLASCESDFSLMGALKLFIYMNLFGAACSFVSFLVEVLFDSTLDRDV